jgi:hypothetical protein
VSVLLAPTTAAAGGAAGVGGEGVVQEATALVQALLEGA